MSIFKTLWQIVFEKNDNYLKNRLFAKIRLLGRNSKICSGITKVKRRLFYRHTSINITTYNFSCFIILWCVWTHWVSITCPTDNIYSVWDRLGIRHEHKHTGRLSWLLVYSQWKYYSVLWCSCINLGIGCLATASFCLSEQVRY